MSKKYKVKSIKKDDVSKDISNIKTMQIIKLVVMSLVFVFAVGYTIINKGLKTFVKDILTLFICAIGGFILFYLILFIIRMITSAVVRKKAHTNVQKEEIAIPNIIGLINDKYNFKYDKSISIVKNLGRIKDSGLGLLKELHNKYKDNDRYYYADFSLEEALNLFKSVVDTIYGKVDGFLEKYKIGDKPIGLLEGILSKFLVGEEEEKKEEKEPTFFSKLVNKVKNTAINVGISVFKEKIEETVVDIFKYLGLKASELYGEGKDIENILVDNKEVTND